MGHTVSHNVINHDVAQIYGAFAPALHCSQNSQRLRFRFIRSRFNAIWRFWCLRSAQVFPRRPTRTFELCCNLLCNSQARLLEFHYLLSTSKTRCYAWWVPLSRRESIGHLLLQASYPALCTWYGSSSCCRLLEGATDKPRGSQRLSNLIKL